MNTQQIKKHQRRAFFYENYQSVWKDSKTLTKLERQLLDLSFGLSGELYSHLELADKFQLKNSRQVKRMIHCALNKLRKERESR